ncbi:ABC transporter ATP-binding protein/permease [Corynebacterium sanguinis]|uniref:ABC transporter ATP-binding protein n=1 Tax=Corynebacterium sanguinis TaxID=2594913 RepID=UPI0021A6488C|nr:ABC transporter ATP-binding protein [Corynebacterium sanguinis]MCT1492076.1 ABC transporter ATP-binding protein/permease [Corynebacterium sanguinis]MCT2247566.1 ABC transporter ATP-binding protein/permease [Corynebacterium sanguinis]
MARPRESSLLRRVVRENKAAAYLAFGTAFLAAFAQVALPALTGRAIDVATGAAQGSISAIAWLMVGLALLTYALSWMRRWSSGLLATNSQHWVRVGLLKTLHRLDGPGQDDIVTGQIVSRSITDLNQFHMVLGSAPMFVTRALQLLATIVVMLTMDVRLTLLSLALMPLILWEANRSRTALYAATWVNQQTAADLASHVEQTVSGVRVVKAFGREDREIDRLDELGRYLYAVKMRAAKLTARFQPLLSQLPKIALVITIVAGGLIAVSGAITIGAFVVFSAYLTSMSSLLSMLTNQYVRLQMGLSSVDRLDQVLTLHPERDDPAAPQPAPPGSGGIRFDDVHFATGGHQVLNGLTLTAAPGETIAVIGPAGAGKSMAVQLAGGFYTPDAGSVSLLDASLTPTNYASMTLEAIRSKVTCVFDEAFLFSSSIRDNIAMGTGATDAEVREAARLARADEFIDKLPEGYDTLVGERGLTLSGGQRQRIALARALLARPAVMVLDDATSAIDADNEAAILDNLRTHLRGVTMIAVAHRQSTVDHADRVVIMERGRVIADGPREEIVALDAYRALMDPTPDAPALTRTQPSRDELWPQIDHGSREHFSASGHGRSIAASEELLARVDALPRATEQPNLADTKVAELREPTSTFKVADLFKAVRWLIAATVILLVIGVLADLALPTLIRAAIDRGIAPGDTDALWTVGALALGVVVIAWAAEVLMTVLSSRSGERLLYGLRLRSYAHLQQLGLSYFERHLSGRIMTRMTTDIDTLSSFLQTGLAQAIVAVGTLIGVTIMLVATDGELTLIALLAVPVIVAATVVFRILSKRYYHAARAQVSLVNGEFAELIGGIRISQMHLAETGAEADFAAESETYRRYRMRSVNLLALYFPGMQAISQVMTAVIVGYGAGRVESGELSVGVLVAFTMYLGQLYGPIQQLGQTFDAWQQATVSFSRITDLLDTRTTVPDTGTSAGAASAARGPLSFDNVSFSYNPQAPEPTTVLSGVNLTLEPGRTVALVGPTGAGKSTVVKLLARFYDPTRGVVRASSSDIASFPLSDWRRALAQVPQESYLFPGTVADNIAYGVNDATDADIEAAVERIGALDIIASIPGGFNHLVGERGRGLSSGQRQIIALARAEMLHPDVVLLDEATATLDPATERAVLDAAEHTTVGRTSVIVAHRLATASRADRILVVNEGRIIEDGTHDELLSTGGHYARMWTVHR